jgi:hypothetical protein
MAGIELAKDLEGKTVDATIYLMKQKYQNSRAQLVRGADIFTRWCF